MTRGLLAALLGFALAIRLLSPAGFMPAFEHGLVTIVSCPDYEPAAPMSQHHHGKSGKLHQPCPYASASAPGTLAGAFPLIAALLVFGTILLFGRTFRFIERHRHHERPPLRGPPLTA